MINFRKLRQDYSPSILKDGKHLYDKKMVTSAKIIKLNPQSVRLNCRVQGSYNKLYQCEIEIDRRHSTSVDSDCDCPSKYDCQHLAAVIYHLEEHLDSIVLSFSKDNDIEKAQNIDETEKAHLRETIKEAETKQVAKQGKKFQKELLQEYVGSSQVLGQSPFFLPEEAIVEDKAELAVIFNAISQPNTPFHHHFELQLALRLPYRSKPLHLPHLKEFLDAVRYQEPLYIGSKRYFFGISSFESDSAKILKMVMDYGRCYETRDERSQKVALMDPESFGTILAECYEMSLARASGSHSLHDEEAACLPCMYAGTLEEPLHYAALPSLLRFDLEYLEAPAPKILLKPMIVLNKTQTVTVEETTLFECAKPGMIYDNTYYRFKSCIRRKHLRNLPILRNVTIPEPPFWNLCRKFAARVSPLCRSFQSRHHRTLCHTALRGSIGR